MLDATPAGHPTQSDFADNAPESSHGIAPVAMGAEQAKVESNAPEETAADSSSANPVTSLPQVAAVAAAPSGAELGAAQTLVDANQWRGRDRRVRRRGACPGRSRRGAQRRAAAPAAAVRARGASSRPSTTRTWTTRRGARLSNGGQLSEASSRHSSGRISERARRCRGGRGGGGRGGGVRGGGGGRVRPGDAVRHGRPLRRRRLRRRPPAALRRGGRARGGGGGGGDGGRRSARHVGPRAEARVDAGGGRDHPRGREDVWPQVVEDHRAAAGERRPPTRRPPPVARRHPSSHPALPQLSGAAHRRFRPQPLAAPAAQAGEASFAARRTDGDGPPAVEEAGVDDGGGGGGEDASGLRHGDMDGRGGRDDRPRRPPRGLRWRETRRGPGRTESGCRNRWVRTQERQLAAAGMPVRGAAEVSPRSAPRA